MKTLSHISYVAFALFAFACFALSPTVRAVTPAPDGGYPGFNTAEKTNALFSLTTGVQNTALGAGSLYSDTTGSTNTAVGTNALLSNTTAEQNTAVGASALASNTASQNVAVGFQALKSNVYGAHNTAVGNQALFHNRGHFLFRKAGSDNTATGYQALFSNTGGESNTANGFGALAHNTAGNDNTANGFQALVSNTSGNDNTAIGVWALLSNITGYWNTAIGSFALQNNTTGFENTAIGVIALERNTIGNFNIALGYDAGSEITGNNNIDIGNMAPLAAESNTIRIGNAVATLYHDGITHPAHTRTFIAGIRGRTTANANAIPVVIDSAGQLGTTSSSRRFKKEIKPMDKASEAILALKPITFHYKSDSIGTPQFGLIAEEVAAVNPDLVVRDENGEIYTVRYEAVNAMLLNEFLKEHGKVQEQGATIAELKSIAAKQEMINAQQQREVKALAATLREQASQIQKVSAQLELNKPAPQTVLNNQ